MWNTVLKRIDNTQTPPDAAQRWGASNHSLRLISEGINLVYRFERADQGYYLRLTHASLRSSDELQAALAYQRHLFSTGALVCEPIISQNALWVETIQQGEDVFLAHVCREVPGVPMHFDYNDLSLYEQWGITLGKLHNAALSYSTANHHYTNWKQSLEELHGYAKHESTALQKTLRDVTEFFNNRTQTPSNYGLTHGDHREGNVLCDGHQIHIIDFDLPSMNWLMEDVARPFFDSIINDTQNWQDKITPYLKGYLSVMPKDSIDLAALPKQIQMKGLEIYLWTKNNWNADTAPGGNNSATWLQRMHQKLTHSYWMDELPVLNNLN